MAKLLFSFLFSFLLSLSSGAVGPQCDFVFTPPEALTFGIEIEKQDPQEFMLTSYYNLMRRGQLEESTQIIKNISKNGIEALRDKDISTLKSTRKYVTILRSAWHLSHKNHESPKSLERFAKNLGHLNDYIAAGKEKEAQREAHLVKKDIKNLDVEKLETLMKPATQKSARSYLKTLRKEAREILKEKTVSLKNYHEVRKILKEFMTYYYLRDELNNEVPGKEYQYLFHLNDELGLLNDQFTYQIINGLAHRKKTEIEFPADLKSKVHYFLENSSI